MHFHILLEGSFPTNKDWCCGVLQVYSDFTPMQSYGSFTNDHKRKEWEERNCNSVVGGSRKTNCLGKHLDFSENRYT